MISLFRISRFCRDTGHLMHPLLPQAPVRIGFKNNNPVRKILFVIFSEVKSLLNVQVVWWNSWIHTLLILQRFLNLIRLAPIVSEWTKSWQNDSINKNNTILFQGIFSITILNARYFTFEFFKKVDSPFFKIAADFWSVFGIWPRCFIALAT